MILLTLFTTLVLSHAQSSTAQMDAGAADNIKWVTRLANSPEDCPTKKISSLKAFDITYKDGTFQTIIPIGFGAAGVIYFSVADKVFVAHVPRDAIRSYKLSQRDFGDRGCELTQVARTNDEVKSMTKVKSAAAPTPPPAPEGAAIKD